MVKLLAGNRTVNFELTTFPDKTSQVWKLDNVDIDSDDEIKILWLFENEGEIMHVCQLAHLIEEMFDPVSFSSIIET